MEAFKRRFKEKYHLTNYQMAQLEYLCKTFFSEFTKILIMAVLFHKHLGTYFFALFVMLFLRRSTGGLHFYTYLGCLATSILYLVLAIYDFLPFSLPFFVKLGILLSSCIICYVVGPIVSKYRPAPPEELVRRGRNTTCFFILLYAVFLCIFPEKPLMDVGVRVIILHSLQLIVAKIRKKGEKNDA